MVTPGAAKQLMFGVQPNNTTAGAAINPAVTVEVLDLYRNLIKSDNSRQVTITVASGPGNFTSGNSVTALVSQGIATFSNLTLDTASTTTDSYSLAAVANGLELQPPPTPLLLKAASASYLSFDKQPSNAQAGTPISPAVTVDASLMRMPTLSRTTTDPTIRRWI